MACGAKEEVPSRLSQQVSEGDESGSPYEHSGSTRCSGGKVGELGLGDSTLEEQLAVLSLWLFPAGILVINGLEGVSHTPRGNPVAMAYWGTENTSLRPSPSNGGRRLPARSVIWQTVLKSRKL